MLRPSASASLTENPGILSPDDSLLTYHLAEFRLFLIIFSSAISAFAISKHDMNMTQNTKNTFIAVATPSPEHSNHPFLQTLLVQIQASRFHIKRHIDRHQIKQTQELEQSHISEIMLDRL